MTDALIAVLFRETERDFFFRSVFGGFVVGSTRSLAGFAGLLPFPSLGPSSEYFSPTAYI